MEIDAIKLAKAQEGVTVWAEKLLDDAERYRWLRSQHQTICLGELPLANVVWKRKGKRTSSLWENIATDIELDRLIDAEREKNT
jgi:hypothetical protein